MKNQYFGDVNDYRKYGILRCLHRTGLTLGVHWMLTPDDTGRDGRKLGYLEAPRRWRRHDPALFDLLATAVAGGERHVGVFERSGLLSDCPFFSEPGSDRGLGRSSHFERAIGVLGNSSLVFFDPDNGIEVPSISVGSAGSSKYLFWNEIEATWVRGQSLLVYQHYPRVPRRIFEERLRSEFEVRLGATPRVLRTGHVAFILVAQAHHSIQVDAGAEVAHATWCI